MKLGERIKQLRGKKSMKAFGQACGITESMVSKMEGGSLTGTLDVHRKICQALGITLSTLYKGVEEEGIKPFDTAPALDEKPFSYNEKASSRFLTRNIFLNKKMLPEILILEPEGKAEDELPPNTQRFLYVLEGEVEVTIGNNTYPLKEGQPFYITDASMPHCIKNTCPAKARILRVTDPVKL